VCGLNAYSTTQHETTLPNTKLYVVKNGIEGVRKCKGSQSSKLNVSTLHFENGTHQDGSNN
jgi:hypothetical protein